MKIKATIGDIKFKMRASSETKEKPKLDTKKPSVPYKAKGNIVRIPVWISPSISVPVLEMTMIGNANIANNVGII